MATATLYESLDNGQTLYWHVLLDDATLYTVSAIDAASAITAAQAVQTAAQQLVTNQQTLQSRAQAALTANATFLALNPPSTLQAIAQVQLLTKECSALIRLALNLFDSVSGT